MTLHIGVKAAVDGSETCTADRLDDCASVVVRAVGIGLMSVEHCNEVRSRIEVHAADGNWKMRTATEHRNCTRLRRRSTCKDCIRGRKTESLKRHAQLSLRHHYRLLPLAERIIAEVKESTHQAKILVKIQLLSVLVSIIRHISNAVPGIL